MIVLRALPALTVGLMLSGTATPAMAKAVAAARCAGGWAGSVQYSRSQSNNSAKTETRVSGKGTETTNWSMTYDYAAQVAVRATADPDVSIGRANISLSSVSTESKTAQDRYICPHERTPRSMSGSFTTQSKTSASGSALEADVDISMDSDGAYTVGVRLPEVQGTVAGSNSSSFSGQCTPKLGVNSSIADMPTTIDGVRFSSSGENRVNPSSPDRLSGSHSVTSYGVTETLRWNLRRCGGALRLVDVKFEHMRFPNWGEWAEITEQAGTIDGNLVQMTAVVANDSPEEKMATVKFRDTYKGDKWDGARPDGLLEELTVTVPAGEEREVTFEWDSSGYAWYDDGRPRMTQRIKAEVVDSGKKVDETTRNLKVAPKPVVLVHGLWSNWTAWESWQNILTTSHSYDWKAFPVGQVAQHGKMSTGEFVGNLGPTNTIAENASELRSYINYAQKDRNAWHIDLVAHSMGGLISRRYIHAVMPTYPDGKPQVSHLVMLGTPNMGSRCADLISVPLEATDRTMNAMRELRPSVVAQFNAEHTNRKGVEFSVLAGNPLPAMCYMHDPNDGVVTVPSAIWTIEDNAQQDVIHTNMATAAIFSSFVKPRVAIGPGKQKGAKPAPGRVAGGGGAAPARLMLLGVEGRGEPDSVKPDFSKIVQLAPGQTLNVSLPVEEARNLGVTFVAATTVSATLADDKGAVADTNLTGTPKASQLFRSLFVDRPIARGNWTLTLKNESDVEREVVFSSWSNAS
ncbi:esterase/lipase family protein [Sphingomonas koreensis]